MQLFILTAHSAGLCSTFGEFCFILYFILILYFTFYIKGHHSQLNGSTEAMLNPADAAVQKKAKKHKTSAQSPLVWIKCEFVARFEV